MKLPEFKVEVLCITYQHASFIKDALDGFCMQQTSFPYIIAVVDDASTDGEQEVINQYLREYFDLEKEETYFKDADEGVYTYAQHKTNKNCYILSLNLKRNLYHQKGAKSKLIAPWTKMAKYIAECEGDDYWIDPLKLQRQTDFLDAYPEYVAVAENGMVQNLVTNTSYPFNTATSHDVTMEEVIITRRFPTAGVIYQKAALDGIVNTCRIIKDTIQWCWLISKGRFRYEQHISSVYRKGEQGMTVYTEPYAFAREIETWNKEILRVFNVRKSFMYLHNAKIYKSFIVPALRQRHFLSALKCLFQGVIYTIKAFMNKIFKPE